MRHRILYLSLNLKFFFAYKSSQEGSLTHVSFMWQHKDCMYIRAPCVSHRHTHLHTHINMCTHDLLSASLLSVQKHMWLLQKPFVFGTLLYSSPPPLENQAGFIAHYSQGGPQWHTSTFPRCNLSFIRINTHILLSRCEFQHTEIESGTQMDRALTCA